MYFIMNRTGKPQAILQGITSIQWKLAFSESKASQIVVRATEENKQYLKKWNFILRVANRVPTFSFMFIEYIEYSEDGQTITIKGYSDLLGNVVNTTTQVIKNVASMTTLFNNNQRFGDYTYVPYYSGAQPKLPDLTPSETTFKTIRETVESFCTLQDCGYRLEWNNYAPTYFYLRFYTEATGTTNSGRFSDAFGNVLSQQYIEDVSDYKNIAYVYGETNEGEERKHVTVDLRKEGEPPLELYVDARDLQSTYKDSSGTEQTYTTEEYEQLLKNRGLEKLASTSKDAYQYKIEVDPNNSLCMLGVDYNLGSIVQIQSQRFGLTFKARVSALTYIEEPGTNKVELTIDILNQ